MKKTFFIASFLILTLVVGFVFFPSLAHADITNPTIGNLGNNPTEAQSGATFTRYFVTIWRALIFIGVLALLFNLVNGAFDWILAGGDSAKIQKGRDKMIQSIIGMIILATSFIFISYLSQLLFSFDLLNLTIPTSDVPQGTSQPGTINGQPLNNL